MVFKTLDVAIGVAFLYLLITFAASAIVEFISNWRNWRGEMLHAGIGNMLAHSTLITADEIYSDPLIAKLCRNDAAPSRFDLLEKRGWRPVINQRPVTFPSYIPACSFSSAVIDAVILKSAPAPDGTPPDTPDRVVAAIQTALGGARNNPSYRHDGLRAIVETTFATRGLNVQALQFALEKWFNDTMDRVTGWYKRRTQGCLLTIGLVLAYSCNIDTIGVTLWLWNGDAARQAVVAAAADYAKPRPAPPLASADAAGQAGSAAAIQNMIEYVANADRQITALQFPVGWPAGFSYRWLLQYLIGCFLSAIAISMGSSFWFDALQSFIKMRGTGTKPDGR